MKASGGKISAVCLTLLLALFAVSLALAVPILWRGFYYLHIEALDLPARTGYGADTIRAAFDAMMDYELKGAPFSTGALKWSEEGMRHFADVRVLFRLDLVLLVLTALLLVLYLFFRKKISLFRFKGFHPSFFAGTGLIVFFGIVSFLAALDFDRAFTVFHRIFFPGKTNWVFDYRTDEIIRILPQVYFRNCAILAVALILLLCAGYIAYGVRTRKRTHAV